MTTACDKCGRPLGEDAPRYIVEIQLTADVSPTLDVDMSEAEVAAELAQVMAALERASAEESEQQVHQRMVFLLCPACRRDFVNDPLGAGRSGHRAVH